MLPICGGRESNDVIVVGESSPLSVVALQSVQRTHLRKGSSLFVTLTVYQNCSVCVGHVHCLPVLVRDRKDPDLVIDVTQHYFFFDQHRRRQQKHHQTSSTSHKNGE